MENVTIVSVPITISVAMMQRLKESLQEELGKDVLVIAHNTQFMKVIRLNPNDTAKVVKRVVVERSTPKTELVDVSGKPLGG